MCLTHANDQGLPIICSLSTPYDQGFLQPHSIIFLISWSILTQKWNRFWEIQLYLPGITQGFLCPPSRRVNTQQALIFPSGGSCTSPGTTPHMATFQKNCNWVQEAVIWTIGVLDERDTETIKLSKIRANKIHFWCVSFMECHWIHIIIALPWILIWMTGISKTCNFSSDVTGFHQDHISPDLRNYPYPMTHF